MENTNFSRLNQVKETINAWQEIKAKALKNGIRANQFINLCLNPNYFENMDNYYETPTPEQTEDEFFSIPEELRNKACTLWNNQMDKNQYPIISNQNEQRELVMQAVSKYVDLYGYN